MVLLLRVLNGAVAEYANVVCVGLVMSDVSVAPVSLPTICVGFVLNRKNVFRNT